MADPTNLLTELDAVNLMIASIGLTPVNTITGTGIRDVNIAKLALDNTTRETLNDGWSFNTDSEWELSIDSNGEVPVPDGVLWVDPFYDHQQFVVRSDSGALKLWDKENRTFNIEANHSSPIKVDITWAYKFEEIPNAARNFIAMRAARKFQANVVASKILYQFTRNDEQEALASLKRLEHRTQDTNWFRQAADSVEIAQRNRNPTSFI